MHLQNKLYTVFLHRFFATTTKKILTLFIGGGGVKFTFIFFVSWRRLYPRYAAAPEKSITRFYKNQ